MKKTLHSIFFALSILGFVSFADAQLCPYPSEDCDICPIISMPGSGYTCPGGPFSVTPSVSFPPGMSIRGWSWAPAATSSPSSGSGTLPGLTSLSPLSTTLYTLSVTGQGINMIADGDFSAWTATSTCFSSGYTLYSGSSMPSDNYSVGTDPSLFSSSFTSMSDHTGDAAAQMLIANSGPLSPSTAVWEESEIPVCPDKQYEFQVWYANLQSVVAMFDAPQIKVVITGVPGGVLYSGTFSSLGGGTWNQLSFTFSSGSASYVTAQIFEVNPSYTPVDFAIDDISLRRLCSQTASVNVVVPSITGATTVCVGGVSSALSCMPAGGTWSSSDPAVADIDMTSGVFTGVSVGTATITHHSVLGCEFTTIVTVIPGIAPIVGPDVICEGTYNLFTNASPGGTWHAWSAVATFSPFVGSVHGQYAGVGPVSYTLGGCTVTKLVTVQPRPTPSRYVICQGFTISLPSVPAGGTWTSGSPGISITPGGSITGTATGIGFVTYTTTSGCTAVSTVTIVNCSNGGSTGAVADTSLCEGDVFDANTLLAIGMTPGGTWSVLSGGGLSITTGGIITATGAGVATIGYTVGGITFTATITVTGSPVSGMGISVSYVPGSSAVVLTGLPAGAEIKYTISNPYIGGICCTVTYVPTGGIIPLSDIFTAVGCGACPVQVCVISVKVGTCIFPLYLCTTINDPIYPKPSPAMEDVTNGQIHISLSPNPNNGSFTLTGIIEDSSKNATADLLITDLTGKMVYIGNAFIERGKLNARVELNSMLADGIYLVRIKALDINKVVRFEVRR